MTVQYLYLVSGAEMAGCRDGMGYGTGSMVVLSISTCMILYLVLLVGCRVSQFSESSDRRTGCTVKFFVLCTGTGFDVNCASDIRGIHLCSVQVCSVLEDKHTSRRGINGFCHMFTSDVKQTTPFLFFWFVIERVHMMHSSMAFRSHLMQQFAAVARNQSRPPIALSRASLARREQFLNSPSDPTLPANQSFEQRNLAPLSARISNKANANFNHVEGRRVMSLEPDATSVDSQEFKDPEDSIDTTGVSITSSSSPCQDVPSLRMLNSDHRSLLDHIILGAQSAPSHGRHSSENCSYMRLISQAAIDTVSEIAYHVTLKRRLAIDPGGAHAFAERKKKRWSQVPAYLVALVRNQPDQVAKNAGVSQYLELPYVPPATALQLADVS